MKVIEKSNSQLQKVNIGINSTEDLKDLAQIQLYQILKEQNSINVKLKKAADFCLKIENSDEAKILFLDTLKKEYNILKQVYDPVDSIFAQNLSDLYRYINFSDEDNAEVLLGSIDDTYYSGD